MLMTNPKIIVAAGALFTGIIAILVGLSAGLDMTSRLAQEIRPVVKQAGGRNVKVLFISPSGWPSRHPLLSGGEGLNEATRAAVATAVADYPGVAGVRWSDGSTFAQRGKEALHPLHCQDDVDALLRTRTIRFEESSANLDVASQELIKEVANALKPCLGSIIAITGHTDSSGSEPGNLELSRARADAVLQTLTSLGIPADGLRATGVGSSQPVEGLAAGDPANRRIEFSVIAQVPVRPTPIDTPAPR